MAAFRHPDRDRMPAFAVGQGSGRWNGRPILGAVTILRSEAWKAGASKVNAALLKHDSKARSVSRLEDFAYVKDIRLLDMLFDLGVIDTTGKVILGQALDLRNGCGHPTKYRPKEKKVPSYIEDLAGIAST